MVDVTITNNPLNENITNFPDTVDADNPIYHSNNTEANCTAAVATAIASGLLIFGWYEARKDAQDKQKEIEGKIFDYYDEDNEFYVKVDHPQQKAAIQYALDLPDCIIECNDCYEPDLVGVACYEGDGCTDIEQYTSILNNDGREQAIFSDRQYAKERWANCVTDQTTALIRATNLSQVDYSKSYAYLQNASAIQSGMAGAAGAGYRNAVAEFSYSLNLIGSIGRGGL